MPTTSRIAAAEDALLSALQARAGLSGVAIDLGHPLDELKPEHIWVRSDLLATQQWDTTGGATGGSKEESIPIPVVIRTRQIDYVTARNRALVLAGEVEGALRADRHLAQPNDVWEAEVASIEKDAFVEEAGWVVILEVTVAVTARLG